ESRLLSVAISFESAAGPRLERRAADARVLREDDLPGAGCCRRVRCLLDREFLERGLACAGAGRHAAVAQAVADNLQMLCLWPIREGRCRGKECSGYNGAD